MESIISQTDAKTFSQFCAFYSFLAGSRLLYTIETFLRFYKFFVRLCTLFVVMYVGKKVSPTRIFILCFTGYGAAQTLGFVRYLGTHQKPKRIRFWGQKHKDCC